MQPSSEERMQRDEALRIVADGVPVLISYVDTQHRYQFINRAYEKLFGKSREEMEGLHVREVLGEASYEEVRPHIEAALAGQEPRFERWMEYKGAGWRCVEVRYVPHLGSEGEVLGVFALVNDITETKQAETALRESEERFRTAVENMLDCFGIYASVRGVDGRIVDFRVEYVNTAACDNNLMLREEQVGRLLCDLLPAHRESGLFDEYCQVVETGTPLVKETLIYSDDYPRKRLERSFDIRAAKLGDGFIAVWRDVTERKRSEEKNRQAEEALRETDRRKDEFLAMLSHELRGPLAPIRNAVQVMHRLGPHDSQIDRMRNLIERQTDHLTRLVDDLLDVSRISRGKITLRKEKVELATVVTRAIETSRPLIDAGGHHLTVELPPEPLQLEGDETRLAQVLSNLLHNAAKYTQPGGQIWLTAERQDGEVELRVKDNGIGIAPEVLPHVFDLFTQAERTLDRAQGGLGIGLTLVKSLVEMHGGTVDAASEGLGQGSVFRVRLPVLATAPAPEKTDEARDPQAFAVCCRVLVVDDNVDSAESLAMLLSLGGMEVRTAHDGPAALEAAHAFHPQVVLLDIGLPQMNGYEVAVRLRDQPEMRQAVLIALTGYGQSTDRQKSREAGFDHHLVKPVDFDVLMALINSLVLD